MKRYVPNCKHRLDITANAEAQLNFVHLSNEKTLLFSAPLGDSMSISEAPEHQYIQAHADVSKTCLKGKEIEIIEIIEISQTSPGPIESNQRNSGKISRWQVCIS